jgi:deoxycytidylate deaminase
MNNFIIKLYSILKDKALESNMTHQLAAGIIIEKKLVNKPCCNINRNYCRGNVCGSIHAEANALLNYYGRNLQFDKHKKRWYLLFYKSKKCKES